MFYGDKINDTRPLFFTSWEKYQQNKPLLPLENQIVEVILAHPEYQAILNNPERFLDQPYFPEQGETNPFLHLGLHIAIREQITTDRPPGIKAIYQNLVKKLSNTLDVEHLMMEQLAECLWQAQRANQPPDEYRYLSSLNSML